MQFSPSTAELRLNCERVGDYFGGIVIDLMKNERIKRPQ